MKQAVGAALLALGLAVPAAAGPYDPALTFRTLRTPHFAIHYHQGEEAMASRLAAIAEDVHVRWTTAWRLTRSGTTQIVLVDQTDVSNGTANVVPWNAIVIYPVPPTGANGIGNTDDWLEYVFTHEYAHILHLDRSRGWARAARALLGRSPVAFPNLTLPLWQIEGIATLDEGDDHSGRLHAGDFREIVDADARAGRLAPLDRVSGGLVDWPSGQGWYAYGARFHQYLAAVYGTDRVRELSNRTAGRLPFLTSGAFRAVFGRPLGRLWRDFQEATRQETAASAERATAARALTRLGYLVDGPGAGPDGTIYFTATDAHRFPGIYRLPPGGGAPERVVSRYGGSRISVSAQEVLFDQLEFVRGTALVSDLYLHDVASGRTRRLTSGARLLDADRSPDGRRIAAVQVRPGARTLVLLDAERLLAPGSARAPGALPVVARAGGERSVFAAPRWSPDGRLLAAERRDRGGPSTIVVLDATTLRQLAAIAAPEGSRVATPAWSPDGATLYFAQADGDATFHVAAIDLGPGGRITRPRVVLQTPGGARDPLVLQGGRIVFVGYGAGGYDLFEAALERREERGDADEAGDAVEALRSGDADTGAGPGGAGVSGRGEGSAYSPLPTLLPRAWTPAVEKRDGRWRVGATAYGVDVLARHAVTAGVTWAVTAGENARAIAPRARPDWEAAYTYQRWQPSFYAAAQDRTSLFDVVTTGGAPVPVAQRERTLDLGVWRSFRRVRWAHTALAAYHVERLGTDTPVAFDERTRAGLRAAWTFTSARRYGHSISLEDGVTLAVTGEALRPAFGSDGVSDAITADARAYLPLGLRHAVLALRGAVAASRGDAGIQRRFRLGGGDADPVAGVFGSDAIALLRGFQDDVFVGDRVAVMNLEARVPLWSVQRGWGTWPLFVRAIHAAAFADLGHAWTGQVRWADRKVGVGAELSADLVAGFGLPLTWTAGIGWGRDGAGLVPDTRELYVRVGRSF